MITGSPYITNYKSRRYVPCELTQPIRNNGAFVRITFVYDKTAHSKVKRICTPGPIVGTGIYDAYRKTRNNWGWVEGNHDGGDQVQVITQGEITLPGYNYSAIGYSIYAIDLQRYEIPNYISTRKTPVTTPGDFANGADADLRYLLGNFGVITEHIGADSKAIIWQGAEIPSIPSYSTGQSFRVHCKLAGDVNAGCPVLLFLDASGDLRGYNCPIPRLDTGSEGQLDATSDERRYPEFGKWGVCETGGSNGDVVEIVIAGFVQVANTGKTGNKLYGDGTFDSYSTGDIHGTDGWVKWFNATDSAAGSLEVQSGGHTGVNRLIWTITNAGNSSEDVALRNQYMPLSDNVNYKFSMYAKAADADVKIYIDLLDSKDETENIATATNITLTTDWALYEHTFTLSAEGREYCELCLAAGAGTDGNTAGEQQSTISIDSISLVEDGFTDKNAQVLGIGLTGFVHKNAQGDRGVLPGTLGTLVNETGMVCLDPGVPEGQIRDYREQQIVKARAWSTVTSSATDKKPVSLWRDADGDLNCVTDNINSPTLENVYIVPEGKYGVQLEDSSADLAWVDVLVRGKLQQDSVIFDLHTNVTGGFSPGEYVRAISQTNGLTESYPGQEFEMLFTENDRTLGSASNWADFSPNSSITYAEDTGNNRIAITGSGTANTTDKKEGAHIPDAKMLKRDDANWNLWSDLTGKSGGDSNWVWDSASASASVVPAGEDAVDFYQTEESFADNETYRVSYTISNHKSGQLRVLLYSDVSAGTGYSYGAGATRTGNGDYTEIVTINQDDGSRSDRIYFQTYGSSEDDFTVSNIKVEPLETGASVAHITHTVALFKCTLWSASNTNPATIQCGREDLSDGTVNTGYRYSLRFLDNGTNVLTTTEREAYAYVYFPASTAGLDGFGVFQTNAVATQWFFKNPSLTYLPASDMSSHGIALSGDNKEYYLF